MPNTMFTYVQRSIEKNPRYRFWFWQVGFWLFMCVVGFFTLILWYSDVNLAYIGHIGMQAVIGLTCSLVLHFLFHHIANFSLSIRTSVGLFLVLMAAFVWTILHMQVFVYFTGFDDVWTEFGGWYFSGIFVFLCWAGMFHGVRYYELLQHEHKIMLHAEANSREEHLKRMRAQSDARDAKLKMLRYQLNPHFLCNTLNAVNSLIEIGESDKAQSMTVQLSEFLRYSLDNDPDTKICLSEEIEALNLYIEIEKTRFAERLSVDIKISDQAQDACVPSLLLQPVIENSMKHAIAHCESGGSITIKAYVHQESLILVLSDSGPGKDYAKTNVNSSKKGVGFSNMEQRLKALYGEDYLIRVAHEESGGLTTEITIPYETIDK